ncbi:MAG: hypothetical protein WD048_14475 [Chitinophagales bacterium]
MYSRKKKLEMMKGLMWDYNIPSEHCLEVLEGKRKNAGHYTEATLFRKLLESYRWFTVLKILDIQRITELLTKELTHSLRFKSLTKNYEFIRKRLQKSV